MNGFLVAVMLGSVAITQLSFAGSKPDHNTGTTPPLPLGKSTVVGGSIRDVDPVRDQFTLKVFGGHPMKILFDERTQVYRDGIRTPLRGLRSEDHASVKTTLDGTNIFALSVHILSQSPEGECQGQVLHYNHGTRELTINSVLSREQIELSVPAGTPIVRIGQARLSQAASPAASFALSDFGSSDIAKGTLISVQFVSDGKGRGVARKISILATPGHAFVFSGNVTFLDLHSDALVLVDPRDDTSYKIFFDPARFSISHNIHEGEHVIVTTNFDGSRYVASAITASGVSKK